MRAGVPIPVTGLGVISAQGNRVADLLAALHDGASGAAAVDDTGRWQRARGARLAALVGAPENDWRPAGVTLRRLSRPSRFAVAAAFQALGESTSDPAGDEGARLGISMATMFGPSAFTEQIMDQTLDRGPAAVSPSLFTECVANAAAAQISLKTAARGPNLTMVARESGPACAVVQALNLLRRGKAERMLAGVAEEMTPFLHSRLDRFAALARAAGGHGEAARPFDRRRNGVLAAEGATVLLLASPQAEAARTSPPLALVLGGATAFDATAGRSSWGAAAETLAGALTDLLARCDVSLDSIDLIVSGAGGSRRGDLLESGVLRTVWGRLPLPPVMAPKAITGEYGGAFLAAAVLAAAGRYRGTPGDDFAADPQAGITPLAEPLATPPRRTLITVPASGGPWGWLLLERPVP